MTGKYRLAATTLIDEACTGK